MTYKRILIPIDGSRTSKLGLREAIRLARGQGAGLQLVHVVDGHVLAGAPEMAVNFDSLLRSLERAGRRILTSAERLVKKQGLAVSSVLLETLIGPAADSIVRQAAKWRADLIVIGTHGRRGMSRVLMGSDAEQIVRTSPVPVLLVRSRK